MAITGVSYRRTTNGLEPIDIVKGGTIMAARKTQLSTRKESVATSPIGYVTEDGKEIVTGAMVEGRAMTLKELEANGIKVATTSNRILTDEDVQNVMNPDIAEERLVSSTKEIFDPVSNPSHYTSGRKYEPRKVIMDWDLNFYLGNVVKYISRAGRKGDEIERLEKGED